MFFWRSCSSKSWFCLVRCSTAAVRVWTCLSKAVGHGSLAWLLVVIAIEQVSTMQLFVWEAIWLISRSSSPQTAQTNDVEKSPVSHTTFACSKQYPHNKKRRSNREHLCGADQIPSEGQVRTSHNSKVSELGWIMRTLVYEDFRVFNSSRGLTSIPWFRSSFLVGILMNIFCGILSL